MVKHITGANLTRFIAMDLQTEGVTLLVVDLPTFIPGIIKNVLNVTWGMSFRVSFALPQCDFNLAHQTFPEATFVIKELDYLKNISIVLT